MAGILVMSQNDDPHPNFRARFSASTWVYRLSMARLLCPVMLATSMMRSPFSNRRDVASWRRSVRNAGTGVMPWAAQSALGQILDSHVNGAGHQ